MIGVDTSFLIDFFKGNKKAIKLAQEHKELATCELVNFEFLIGNLTQEQEATFLRFINNRPSYALTQEATKQAAKTYREAKQKGKTLPLVDCLIASTYQTHGITHIATKNNKHFTDIPTIQTITY